MTDGEAREMARALVRGSIIEDAAAQFIAQILRHAHDERIKPLNDRIEALVKDKERLEAAMVEAIRLSKQPHYGDLDTGMDHYAEAMDVIRAALKGEKK